MTCRAALSQGERLDLHDINDAHLIHSPYAARDPSWLAVGPPTDSRPPPLPEDPQGPGLRDGPIAGNDLRGTESQSGKLSSVVQITESGVGRKLQLRDREMPPKDMLWRRQHRRLPNRLIAEYLGERTLRFHAAIERQVVHGVVDAPPPPRALARPDEERMTRD
jgi:hypothetical protein